MTRPLVFSALLLLTPLALAPAAPVPTHLMPRDPPLTFPTAVGSATHDRLSRDGTRLAAWDDPKTVSVWDLAAGKRVFGPWRNDTPGPLIFGPKESEGLVSGLALSSDGRLLAAATDSSGTLTIWNADTGGVSHQHRRYRGFVQGFGFAADGTRLLLWASDNLARVYDTRTGAPVGPALRPVQAKAQYVRVNPNECAISDDGRRLAFFENVSGTVRLWDADRADALLSVTVPERTPASRMWFSPDGARVNLVVGGKTLGVEVPRFDVPAELTGPLVRFLTGQRIDETDGIEFVDQFIFRNDLATYRRAFLRWRGIDDDPARSPPARRNPTADKFQRELVRREAWANSRHARAERADILLIGRGRSANLVIKTSCDNLSCDDLCRSAMAHVGVSWEASLPAPMVRTESGMLRFA